MIYSSPANKMSNAELLDYSHEHLRYEIWMFFNSGLELSRRQFDESDPASVFLKNVVVESFINHLRNLLLFLYPYSPNPDDVLSDLFFSDPISDWKKKRQTESESLRNVRTRASQEISHLTVSRREPDDESKKWLVVKLMSEIKAILKTFVDHASPSKLNRSVIDLVNEIDLDMSSAPALDTFRGVNATTTAPIVTVVVPPLATEPITKVSSSSPPVKRP
jgi:hypothetical protein